MGQEAAVASLGRQDRSLSALPPSAEAHHAVVAEILQLRRTRADEPDVTAHVQQPMTDEQRDAHEREFEADPFGYIEHYAVNAYCGSFGLPDDEAVRAEIRERIDRPVLDTIRVYGCASPEARCALLQVASRFGCHHEEPHTLVTDVPEFDDPRRESVAATAEALLDAACADAGVDPLSEAERGALRRRVRPSVLQVLDVHGDDSTAAACAMRFVAVDADCTCGAGHVLRRSFWNYAA